jgi:hypothetical protein
VHQAAPLQFAGDGSAGQVVATRIRMPCVVEGGAAVVPIVEPEVDGAVDSALVDPGNAGPRVGMPAKRKPGSTDIII